MEDGALETLDEFLVDLYDEFRNWDVIGIQEGKDDFYTLLLEKDIYEPLCRECFQKAIKK